MDDVELDAQPNLMMLNAIADDLINTENSEESIEEKSAEDAKGNGENEKTVSEEVIEKPLNPLNLAAIDTITNDLADKVKSAEPVRDFDDTEEEETAAENKEAEEAPTEGPNNSPSKPTLNLDIVENVTSDLVEKVKSAEPVDTDEGNDEKTETEEEDTQPKASSNESPSALSIAMLQDVTSDIVEKVQTSEEKESENNTEEQETESSNADAPSATLNLELLQDITNNIADKVTSTEANNEALDSKTSECPKLPEGFDPIRETMGRAIDPEIKEKVDEIAESVLTNTGDDEVLDVNLDQIVTSVVKDFEASTFAMTAGATAARTEEEDVDESPKKKKKSVAQDESLVTYPEEELKEAFELFEKKRTLPAYLMRDAVLDYARRQSVKFMVAEDYDSASRNDALVHELIREYSKDSGGYDADTLTRTLQSRIQQANERNHTKHMKYNERIAAIKQNEQSKIDKLLEQQEQEREQFEADCHRPEFLQRFSKPSTKLLHLRRIQKSLALAHKFDEAKSVKLEGDRLQREETIEAQHRAIQHIKKTYAQLIDRQQQQLDCAMLFGQRKVRTVEGESIKEKEAHNNLTKQLQTKLQETKARARSSLPPLQSSGSKIPQSKATRNQLMKYKKSPDVTLLNVRLTNLKSVMTMKPPSALKPVKIA